MQKPRCECKEKGCPEHKGHHKCPSEAFVTVRGVSGLLCWACAGLAQFQEWVETTKDERKEHA